MLQCLRKLGDGGVWEGVVSTSEWAPTAAGTRGCRRRAKRGCSRPSEIVYMLLWMVVHRRPKVGQLLRLIGRSRWRRGAVSLEPLDQALLLSSEIEELFIGEASSASVTVVLDAIKCTNVWTGIRRKGTFVGKRIGGNVGAAAAMWVPAERLSKIMILLMVSIFRKAGGGRGLLDRVGLISPGKVVSKNTTGGAL